VPERQLAMLTSLSAKELIPADHPIRRIRVVVDRVLAELDGEFEAMYSTVKSSDASEVTTRASPFSSASNHATGRAGSSEGTAHPVACEQWPISSYHR
jgi:hypothetical protein